MDKKTPQPDSNPPQLKDAFFDLDLGANASAQQIYRTPTLMRTTEWGGLTVVSLLAAFLFPPYFAVVLAIAFLNAGGLLWVTHLSEKGRKRLVEFEAQFRQGYALEQKKMWKKAAEFYASLEPQYLDFPKIAEIAHSRILYLRQQHPGNFSAGLPEKRHRERRSPGPERRRR